MGGPTLYSPLNTVLFLVLIMKTSLFSSSFSQGVFKGLSKAFHFLLKLFINFLLFYMYTGVNKLIYDYRTNMDNWTYGFISSVQFMVVLVSGSTAMSRVLWSISVGVIPPRSKSLDFFFFFFKSFYVVFIILFIQYYSVICRPSDHTVGRPRAEIRTRARRLRGRDTTPRPPQLLKSPSTDGCGY